VRRRRIYLAAAAVGLSVLLGVSQQSAARPTGARALSVGCGNIIGSTRSTAVAPSRIILGVFAAPAMRLQRAALSGDARWPYFAKSGVEIRAGVGPVAVLIPSRMQGQAAISWGNGLPVVATVRFPRCRPSPDRWNAYAGGFFTRSPTACITVVVRIGARSKTTRVSIGQRCSRLG
jgi:hypothetical protein